MKLPPKLEAKLTAFRQSIKAETGKLPFRDTAILMLIEKSLTGVDVPKPMSDRVTELERCVAKLMEDRRS